MSRGIEILLSEILDAIALLRDYTEGLDFDAFAANVEKQDSVIRWLEIIGEAVKGIRLKSGQGTPACHGATSLGLATS